jgi:predicted methyltransferase
MRKTAGWPERRVRDLLMEIRGQADFGARHDLDQCPATPSTVMRRLTLLGRRSSDILLLGDDDLLSLVLALTGARNRIAAVDLDDRLLRFIESYSKRYSIEVLRHDLRFGLPRAHKRCFDEVFTDPPYTLAGQLLFVHRAMGALRSMPGVSLFVCASREYLTVQELSAVRSFLSRGGFELEATYPDFNCYRAPPDVREDLKKKGRRCTTWLYSDLFHYMRRNLVPMPCLPRARYCNIYEYPS